VIVALILVGIAAGLVCYFASFGVESRWLAAGLLTVGAALAVLPGTVLL
jgi:hypothetical protein